MTFCPIVGVGIALTVLMIRTSAVLNGVTVIDAVSFAALGSVGVDAVRVAVLL